VAVARPAVGLDLDHGGVDVVDLRAALAANLEAFSRAHSPLRQRPAAVAIVVIDAGGEPAVPIFQRTSAMSRHAGQMALPGGGLHQGESVEECAIRELHEELGLLTRPDHVLGSLDDFDTRSGFTITPVVIWSDSRLSSLSPSAAEVERVFAVPLAVLRAAAAEARSRAPEAFSLRLPDVEVFAPTAAILYQFSEVALEGRTVRVTDFFQPPWTHR
jgi:8-oxo-dGTP pyrophosphatase MutT (NUDIX family)